MDTIFGTLVNIKVVAVGIFQVGTIRALREHRNKLKGPDSEVRHKFRSLQMMLLVRF